LFEVKRRGSGYTELYKWIEDEREKPDAVALRVDRKPWLIVMTLEKYLAMRDGRGVDGEGTSDRDNRV
jgi:hypothetical protein